mmetsp:Transcript_48722/g.96143  ORF Transcript_48722/g.96143 Transcript_48722/m.96143 type:complete len:229 (-) Transcript_48722:826-1512(-)
MKHKALEHFFFLRFRGLPSSHPGPSHNHLLASFSLSGLLSSHPNYHSLRVSATDVSVSQSHERVFFDVSYSQVFFHERWGELCVFQISRECRSTGHLDSNKEERRNGESSIQRNGRSQRLCPSICLHSGHAFECSSTDSLPSCPWKETCDDSPYCVLSASFSAALALLRSSPFFSRSSLSDVVSPRNQRHLPPPDGPPTAEEGGCSREGRTAVCEASLFVCRCMGDCS